MSTLGGVMPRYYYYDALYALDNVYHTDNEPAHDVRNLGGCRTLMCPVCGSEDADIWVTSQHIQQPITTGIEDDLEQVVIPMQGECGHKWQIVIGYLKGEAFICTRIDQDDPRTPDDEMLDDDDLD